MVKWWRLPSVLLLWFFFSSTGRCSLGNMSDSHGCSGALVLRLHPLTSSILLLLSTQGSGNLQQHPACRPESPLRRLWAVSTYVGVWVCVCVFCCTGQHSTSWQMCCVCHCEHEWRSPPLVCFWFSNTMETHTSPECQLDICYCPLLFSRQTHTQSDQSADLIRTAGHVSSCDFKSTSLNIVLTPKSIIKKVKSILDNILDMFWYNCLLFKLFKIFFVLFKWQLGFKNN